MAEKTVRRKFQVSRSHPLDFAHLSRVLYSLAEKEGAERVGRGELREATGLPDGQVESLVNIAVAMGLVEPRIQTLTPTGRLIVKHDIFFEGQGSLEWCHFVGAGSYRNLIWYDVFNHLLVEESALTMEGWRAYFVRRLAGVYTEKSLRHHAPEEVRFVVDAYLERNFRKLELLQRDPAGRLYRRRYTAFEPPVLCAMIYAFCAGRGLHSPQVGEMAVAPGSPAVLFGLDVGAFRQSVEGLHERGWLRYETTHDLDQVRLIPGFGAIEFLEAHYEERAPRKREEASGTSEARPGGPAPRRSGEPRPGRQGHDRREDAASGDGADETADPPGSDPQRGLFE